MTQHKPVLATVKTLVDASLKDIIEALNKIPDLWTCSSCEGNKEEWAAISLYYGSSNSRAKPAYSQLAKIANDFCKILEIKNCEAVVSLEWFCNKEYYPIMSIEFPREETKNMLESVIELLKDYASKRFI